MIKQQIIGEDEKIEELKKLKRKVDDFIEDSELAKQEVNSLIEKGARLSDDIKIYIEGYEHEGEVALEEVKEVIIELIKVIEQKTDVNLTQLLKKLNKD